MSNPILEPQTDPYALAGRIVTMNDNFDVIDDGLLYIRQGTIHAVTERGDAVPEGFEDAPIIDTEGTIFPGMIELHNHLSYNILPLWNVPRRFDRRSQWRNHPQKRALVTAPMAVLGKTPDFPEAIVRYVESKCLVAGVTASQGISLYGVGLSKFYRGIVRNVESPTDPKLHKAHTKISDVDKDDVQKFWIRLQEINGTFLLHLCEGIDGKARRHFEALKLDDDDNFAINDHLTGIHSTALTPDDFKIMAKREGAIVWSPLSNLLLYGETTNIKAAHAEGVMIALGSDWSPSGSKNLLGELKVAQLVIDEHQLPITPRDIVAMTTSNPAKILKWDSQLGSLEPEKQADLLVITDGDDDPHQTLIDSTEEHVELVIINGVPRYGIPNLMEHFGPESEKFEVAGKERWFNLRENDAHQRIRDLTLAAATKRLEKGLENIVDLALDLQDESNPVGMLARTLSGASLFYHGQASVYEAITEFAKSYQEDASSDPPVFLDMHEDEFEGFLDDDVPEFEGAFGNDPLPDLLMFDSAADYSEIVAAETYRLDPLTIPDDPDYFTLIAQHQNLPNYLKQKLPQFYGIQLTIPPEGGFLANTPDVVRPQFYGISTIKEFMQQSGLLSNAERRVIVEQALLVLEQFYVHLPLKQSMHAVDPLQRLRLMLFALDQREIEASDEYMPEIEFHKEILRIFASLRDLHTTYILPSPYRGKVAFLPFIIEEFFDEEEDRWRYIVTKVAGDYTNNGFKKRAEVLHWNGIPIERAIAINAERYGGSNQAARHARGLDNLTIRPLGQGVPPDEEWVTIHYRELGSDDISIMEQDWLVFSPGLLRPTFHELDDVGDTATAMGLDWHGDMVQQAKKALFVPNAVQAEQQVIVSDEAQGVNGQFLDSFMPTVFRAQKIGKYGYIRIFTFHVENAAAFVDEFVRLSEQLPKSGLIIDIRSNPGGLIPAAECLLQALAPDLNFMPERAQFINSTLTLELCKLHGESEMFSNLKLAPWFESIRQSIRTGSIYSQGIPITNPNGCNPDKVVKQKKKVLIVDALCYSSADIFAAGFQDHNLGEIIGTSDNTGAGGANVWGYELLEQLMSISKLKNLRLKPLPNGATMRVAIRRTLRVGEREGMPIEDMGINIHPKNRHRMTQSDVLGSNDDLLEFAAQRLDAM